MITNDIDLCIEALTKGDVVAFPTETVFGLGARADSPLAVKKIFDLKQRPNDHPLILHCANIDVALAVSPHVPDYARVLAANFWPGPMTLIFKRGVNDAISDEAVGGHSSVGIRVPSHETARRLLEPCSFFVAAPSANKFGRVSPTTAHHVYEEFGDEILILDGEPSQCGLESTIISCLEESPEILRPGAITEKEILNATGLEPIKSENKVVVSGSLEKHYQPDIPLITFNNVNELNEISLDKSKAAYIGLAETDYSFSMKLVVSTYDQYAHEMYNFFREAEKNNCETIVAQCPINEGIGIAINDRLTKASKK
ncbi:MAG: L-threonylcarbamoyladenylate synthase [Acidimicrobiia bacterium]